MKLFISIICVLALTISVALTLKPKTAATKTAPQDSLILDGETHFANMRQLTFGGENAEAYASFNSQYITFQRKAAKEGLMCDQIYYGKIPTKPGEKFNYSLESTGKGRTTCSYFLPGDSLILYASTHAGGPECPPEPDREKLHKYVWPVYNTYDIYIADLKGHIKKQLTKNNYYDAEATVSTKGDKIVFTSNRSGDFEIWTMKMDSTGLKQITHDLGYDGGPNFSPDGKHIVWRASRPNTEADVKEYKDLMAQGLVAPTRMDVFICDADGSHQRQLTHTAKGANWAPAFTPDGMHIIYSSNFEHERGYPFNLYLMDLNGEHTERISKSESFDAFPMFTPDGKHLIFCSNRRNGGGHDINVFITDWK